MSRLRALVGHGSNRGVRRLTVPPRRRRPAVERLEELVLLSNTLTVINTNGMGPGSLEQVITTANADNSATQTTIDFDIPTSDPGYNASTGTWTIKVGNGTGIGLPTITVPIVLDGWSQGPTVGGSPYSGPPLVVLDGTDVTGSIGDGLVFGQDTAGSSQPSIVEGLSLVNWKYSSEFGGGTAIDIGPVANNPVTIQGNYIGVEPDGTTAGGNDVSGITVQSSQNIIGGTTAAARNIIGFNGNNAPNIETGAGIVVETGVENLIEGNYIGVGADGHTAVPNNIGVHMTVDTNINRVGNRLGGTLSGDGNVISGNTQEGVDLDGDENDLVQGNIIGMNATDTAAVPNGGGGILAQNEALSDTIGGVGNTGNVIAGNTGNGVSVGTNTTPPNSAGIAIQNNSITANTGLGIALGGFTTPLINDSEGHDGPNALQNYLVITSANVSSGNITIDASFSEAEEPNTTLVADFYADPGDSSGYGQGAVLIGSAQIGPTNASGVAPPISLFAVDNVPAGDIISATATVSDTQASGITVGDTSEFSPDFALAPSPTATQLVVTTPPAPNPVTADQSFGLTVSAENGSGTVDTTYDQNVTVTIMSGPAGAVLAGTTMMTASAGAAGFQELVLDTAGTYTLKLQSGTLTPTTTTIQVNAATAEVVAVTTAPTPFPVGLNQPFSLVAEIQDDFGNVVTDYTQNVTVSLESGGPSGTLGGTTTATTDNGLLASGVATFNSLTLNVPGDYLLQVASDDLNTAFDVPINVSTSTTATQLVVTTPPAPNPVAAASNFTLTVSAEDGSGTVDSTYTSNVVATIMSGPAGATLGGMTTVPAVAGAANFSQLNLNKAGTYTLKLASGTLTPTTATITVNAAAATKLVVTEEPTPNPVTAGATFTAVVSAEDSDGNVDTNYTGPITLAIATGPSGGSLGGGGPINAVGGVVTFNQLLLPQTGTYTLQATSGSLTLATTDPISVNAAVAVPPTVTNLQRFGFHAQPTMLVLTFSEGLNPTPAEDVTNYTVTGASGTTYPVTSAVYNSADDTVTLSFGQRLDVHLTYTITVNGMAPNGLTSTTGLLLDGAGNGQPGSNYVQTFGRGILAGDAAEVSEAPNMVTLEQINHGHITDRAIEELVARGNLKAENHHRHAKH